MISLLIGGGAVNAQALAQAPQDENAVVANHVLVKLAPGVTSRSSAAGVFELVSATGAVIDESRGAFSAVRTRAIVRTSSVDHRNGELAAEIGLDRWITVEIIDGVGPIVAAARLRLVDGVEFAEVDGVGGVAEFIPDDPMFTLQWPLKNTGQSISGVAGVSGADLLATEAWQITTGGRSIVVGVLDSGVSPHPDLAGRILPGWNVPQQSAVTTDGCSSHGTHVSGIIGATGNNAVATAGLCWDVMILPVVVVNPCSGTEAWVADGITWAVDNGAELINMSLQYSTGSQYLHDAVNYAALSGVPMLAATGNSGSTPPSFPARWPETIAVAATDNQDQQWPFSNYGPQVDVAAPGVSVLSLSSAGGVTTKTGTSMAAPHATGVLALMRSINPDLTAAELRQLLTDGADDVGAAGFDPQTGFGRINALTSVLLAQAALPIQGDLNDDGVVNGADLGLLLSAWGSCASCSSCPADLDGDCSVNGADLGVLLSQWSAQ